MTPATATATGEQRVARRSVFIFIGASPNTDWLGDQVARDPLGFILAGPELRRPGRAAALAAGAAAADLLETSLPGVFVAGDVRHGSIKRVAGAVGDGSMCRPARAPVPGDAGVIEAFRQVDLFDEVGDACLERLSAVTTEERLAAGDYVVRTGQMADRFCVLVEGAIEWVRMLGNEEVVMATRPAPTYFGATNLLTEEPSQADGRIMVASRMYAVPGADFLRLLRDEKSVLKGRCG